MPTGYTAAIKDGISFQQFAMACARAFGALVMMRDEPSSAPIPDFQPSNFHVEHLELARAELARLQALTPQEMTDGANAEFSAAMARHHERANERAALKEKYQAMLNEAKAWTPPTPDHQGLKDFMVKQIEESIKWDCDDSLATVPICQSSEQWFASAIAKAGRDIIYHTEKNQEEIDRTNGRNKWVRDLRQSLETPKDA